MKILHVVPSYLPARRYGGPIESVHGLCRALVRQGHEVHVFTTNVDGSEDSDVPLRTPVPLDGVLVHYFRSPFLRRLYYAPSMEHALRRELPGFDVAHLHSIYLWPTWAAACAAKRLKVPFLIAPRGMLVKDLIRKRNTIIKYLWIELIEKHNLKKASGIHLTTEVEADELKRLGLSLPPQFIIPNGIDAVPEAPQDADASEAVRKLCAAGPFVLFLGRLNWEKGIDLLITALVHASGFRLVLAGNDENGYKKSIEGLAASHHVSDRVHFAGAVYGADKRELLRSACALALVSPHESFGNVVLEAMREGCPVIVTGGVGISDGVRRTGAGIVCARGPKPLAEAIESLMNDEALRRAMGRKGQEAARNEYGWDSIAARTAEAYSQIAAKAGRRG